MIPRDGKRTFRTRTFEVPAGEERPIPGAAEWCEILLADFDTISVDYIDAGSFESLPKGVLITFDRTTALRFHNTGVADATITVAFGLLDAHGNVPRDSRLTLVNGSQVAVQGIAGGTPVEVMGPLGAAIATADDPLPDEPFEYDYFDTAAAGDNEIVSAAANVNGIWIYEAWLGTAIATFANTSGANLSVDATTVILKAFPSSANAPQSIRRTFVPPGINLVWRCLSANQANGFISYKLVP